MATTADVLTDADELLFRQVHPSFVREGRPSSQAFRPTPKDENKLSVARGALTTPKAAYEHHTVTLGLASAGSWAVTIAECTAQTLGVLSDPLTAPPEKAADPAHAVIDFTGVSKSQTEAKASRLARFATARGRLYSAEVPSAPEGVT